jgi:hypothetical protein
LLLFLIVGQFGKNTSKFFFFFLRTLREVVPVCGEGRFCPFLLCVGFDRNSSPRLLHFNFSKGINFNLNTLLLFINESTNGIKAFFFLSNQQLIFADDRLLLFLFSLLQLLNCLFACGNCKGEPFFFSTQFLRLYLQATRFEK